MWKKDGEATEHTPSTPETSSAPSGPSNRTSAPASGQTATIGKAITIKGEVSGDEDLVIQGRVEGSIELGKHSVTVGSDGVVTASMTGRVVTVEGRVEGDIVAEERVVLRASSHVEGDIAAPRVVLEDGAVFKGGVDMGERRKGASPAAGEASTPVSTKAKDAVKDVRQNDAPSTPAGKKSGKGAPATAGASGD